MLIGWRYVRCRTMHVQLKKRNRLASLVVSDFRLPLRPIYHISNTDAHMDCTWRRKNSFRDQTRNQRISFLKKVGSKAVHGSLVSIYFFDSGTKLWPASSSVPGNSPNCCVLGLSDKELVEILLQAFAVVVARSSYVFVGRSSFLGGPRLLFRQNFQLFCSDLSP